MPGWKTENWKKKWQQPGKYLEQICAKKLLKCWKILYI